jgi:hypothetical protein
MCYNQIHSFETIFPLICNVKDAIGGGDIEADEIRPQHFQKRWDTHVKYGALSLSVCSSNMVSNCARRALRHASTSGDIAPPDVDTFVGRKLSVAIIPTKRGTAHRLVEIRSNVDFGHVEMRR